MRTRAPRGQTRSAKPEERRAALRRAQRGPERTLSDRDSLLDHLEERPAAALADSRAQVPSELLALDGLEARSGEDAAAMQAEAPTLLDVLDAEAATGGPEPLRTGPEAKPERFP
jgi:hypothetical protein